MIDPHEEYGTGSEPLLREHGKIWRLDDTRPRERRDRGLK
jgi:hypothetical protein